MPDLWLSDDARCSRGHGIVNAPAIPAMAAARCCSARHDRAPGVTACPDCWTAVIDAAMSADRKAAAGNLRTLLKATGCVCAFGACSRTTRPGRHGFGWCSRHLPDEVAVARAVAGDPPASMLPGERVEAVRQLAAQALTDDAIADRLRIADRSVSRIRADYGIPSRVPLTVIPGHCVRNGSLRPTRDSRSHRSDQLTRKAS